MCFPSQKTYREARPLLYASREEGLSVRDINLACPLIEISYDSLSKLTWFESLKIIYPNYNKHSGIMDEILFRDSETDELIPKDFTIQVHKTDGDIWLSELDMEILEIENYSTYKEMDKISYEQYLLDNEISDKLIEKLEEFEDTWDNPYLMNLRKQQLIDFKEGRFPF